MSDIGKVTPRNNDYEDEADRQIRLLTSFQTANDIVKCYRKYGVEIRINDDHTKLWGDGLRFKVQLKGQTTINQIKKYAENVRIRLRLPELKPIFESGSLYLSTAKKSPKITDNGVLEVSDCLEYKEAFESEALAHPIGIDSKGNPFIVDLAEFPHAMVCGMTTSGKTVSLHCMIASLLHHQPREVNLLLCDRLLHFSAWTGIPHLSYPIIDDEETFASAILLLKDEMNQRLELKKTNRAAFEQCPYIVCIVDEFPSFLRGLDKKRANAVVNAINCMLEEARHQRIHFILTVRDPTSDTIGIKVSDLRTKLVFQVANPQKSLNALGLGKVGAEKLKGSGDMYFYQGGEPLHLQGVNITDEEIGNIVKKITSSFEAAKENSAPDDDIRVFPRGRYGFTITDDDIQQKNALFALSNKRAGDGNAEDKRLADVIFQTLSKNAVSINDVQKLHGMSHHSKAVDAMEHMQKMGIVGPGQGGPKKRDVLPKSIADLSAEVRSLLERYDYTEEDITGAFAKRTGTGKPETDDAREDSFGSEGETEDEQTREFGLAFSSKITLTDQ